MGSEGFSLFFLLFFSLFFAFFIFLHCLHFFFFCLFCVFLRFSSTFLRFLRFSPRTRANDCNLPGKWGFHSDPRLHRPRSELPELSEPATSSLVSSAGVRPFRSSTVVSTLPNSSIASSNLIERGTCSYLEQCRWARMGKSTTVIGAHKRGACPVDTEIKVKSNSPKIFLRFRFRIYILIILIGTDDLSHSCPHRDFTLNYTFVFACAILKVINSEIILFRFALISVSMVSLIPSGDNQG